MDEDQKHDYSNCRFSLRFCPVVKILLTVIFLSVEYSLLSGAKKDLKNFKNERLS
jgi:hypothetical protein